MRDFAIPDDARRQKNALEATQQNLDQGLDQYLEHCANCHGRDGSGLTAIGQSLYPRVPNLQFARTQNLMMTKRDVLQGDLLVTTEDENEESNRQQK